MASSDFVRFILTGGIAAGANALSRILFSLLVSYELAIVFAYLVGMITAYLLARAYVFQPSGRSAPREFLRFALVNVAALAQVWAASIGLARYVFPVIGLAWHAELVAHLIGISIPIVTSYYGHKYFSFGSKRNAA